MSDVYKCKNISLKCYRSEEPKRNKVKVQQTKAMCNNHHNHFTDVGIWCFSCYDVLHAIIPYMHAHFLHFWHFNPYILQHFSENVLHLFHWFLLVATYINLLTIARSFISLAYL